MGAGITGQWKEIGDTGIYSTGHYLITVDEIKDIFESKLLEDQDNVSKIENREIITAELIADRRVSFHFFPFKNGEKYIMEGFSSSGALKEIQNIIPVEVKRILKSRKPIKYL